MNVHWITKCGNSFTHNPDGPSKHESELSPDKKSHSIVDMQNILDMLDQYDDMITSSSVEPIEYVEELIFKEPTYWWSNVEKNHICVVNIEYADK